MRSFAHIRISQPTKIFYKYINFFILSESEMLVSLRVMTSFRKGKKDKKVLLTKDVRNYLWIYIGKLNISTKHWNQEKNRLKTIVLNRYLFFFYKFGMYAVYWKIKLHSNLKIRISCMKHFALLCGGRFLHWRYRQWFIVSVPWSVECSFWEKQTISLNCRRVQKHAIPEFKI